MAEQNETGKEFDRSVFDAIYNENGQGKRVNNKPYPESIRSAESKKAEAQQKEAIKNIPNTYGRGKEYR